MARSARRTRTVGGQPDTHFAAIRYATYLEASATEIGAKRSGQKSQLRLFAAAARLLESVSYRDLNVEDISTEAKLAKGTFYVYFDSKDEFLRKLVRRYVAFEIQTYPQPLASDTQFGGVRRWVNWYIQTFAANIGLLRCMVQLSTVDKAVRALWHQRNGALVDRAMSDALPRMGRSQENLGLFRLVLRTAGGMLDQSLFTRYGLQASSGADLQQIDDELLALLMHRAIYATDPPRSELVRTAALVAAQPT